ncbi:ubiquinol-cytochrome C chaperone family protein [Pelagerythrobacter marensis]|uniref:Ubiquinol-cytochrome C chaperone family protein n=1 Tax=Pelagerythrobacter marensis TaxID=543877 RepID=A0ABZ2DAR6_9SPHN
MAFLAKIFGRRNDPRDELVPLWRAVVATARQPEWYSECGVADCEEGRFDMLCAALATVIVRMERNESLHARTALLTELFVEDIEGQLRQQGIGDPTLGKRMGKLMSALGGRIGAYRAGFSAADDSALAEAVDRNVTFAGTPDPRCVARRLRAFHGALLGLSDAGLLNAEFDR